MNKTCKGPYKAPTLPERPKWGADELLKTRSTSRKAVIEEFEHSWNQWADKVDNIFRQMSEQADELGATEEDLIKFIQTFSNHPPRPTLHGIEYYQKEDRPLTKEFVENILNARFRVRWNDFATSVQLQSILRSMLGPGRAFQAVVPIQEHELSRKMDKMDIQERH